jgi:lipopolysaccharide export system protein LptA
MRRWALIAAGLALALNGTAQAQIATNSDAPVDITADELEVVNAQCLAVWRGAAEALQDRSRLRADVLRIFNKPLAGAKTTASPVPAGGNCGPLERMEAEGNVFYVTPTQRVRGDNAVYAAAPETITITGDVVATQGKNVLSGERLVIQVKTGEARMETSVKGRNKPGRVRGVFYPDETREGGSAPKN